MKYDRRTFLLWSGVASAATLWLRPWAGQAKAEPLGALVPDPNGILDLPPGFSYQILDQTGALMDDDYRVPGYPDGMACFPGEPGTFILMRNHELYPYNTDVSAYGANQVPPPEAYDPLSMGAVTRVVINATTLERISSNLVLVGTNRNCAGGPSPWGWLSCEESVDEGHGYVFLCPTDAETVQDPQKIPGYGRFYHEAVCIDPSTRYAYLTEDRTDGYLYRFVPDHPSAPFEGRLQAMRHAVVWGYDTDWMTLGQSIPVNWVDVDEVDPVDDSIRDEVYLKGGARLVRGEGIWFADGAVYICSTSGGPVLGGQIFRLDPGEEQDTLTLIAVSTDRSILDMPDNIAMAPWGDLYMAEDGAGAQFVRGLTPEGQIFDFARNAMSDTEIAGVCFAPDGSCMFLNLHKDGLTLVITGSFPVVQVEPEPDPDFGVPDTDAGVDAAADHEVSVDDVPQEDGLAVSDPGTGLPPDPGPSVPDQEDSAPLELPPIDDAAPRSDSLLIGLPPSDRGGCTAADGGSTSWMIPAAALGAYLFKKRDEVAADDT
jgi:hypothetical protein